MGGNILGGALLIGAAVYFSKQQADKLAGQISWSFDGIGFSGATLDNGLTILLRPRLKVNNASNLSVQVEKFEGKILYLGRELAPIKSVEAATIAANKETILRFEIGVSKKSVEQVFGTTWAEVWKNRKNYLHPSNFVLVGTIHLTVGGIAVAHDISEPFVIS